jgi:hypothetical protein
VTAPTALAPFRAAAHTAVTGQKLSAAFAAHANLAVAKGPASAQLAAKSCVYPTAYALLKPRA